MSKQLYIFDLDQTLVDTREKKPYFEGKKGTIERRQGVEEIIRNPDIINPKLYSRGFINMLARLNNNPDCEVVVLTNSPKNYAKAILNRFEFPEIRVYGSAEKPCCPDYTLGEIIRENNSTPEKTLFIGDSPIDILAGHQVKARSLGCLWGSEHGKDKLNLACPSELITNPDELELAIIDFQKGKIPYVPRDIKGFTGIPKELFPFSFNNEIILDEFYPNVMTPSGTAHRHSSLLRNFKRFKDEPKLEKEITFDYYAGGVRKGDNMELVFNYFYQRVLKELREKGLFGPECLMVSVPNSNPEYCYLHDWNQAFVTAVSKELGFIQAERIVTRYDPVPSSHEHEEMRDIAKQFPTFRIVDKNYISQKPKKIILFDDVRTSGTNTAATGTFLKHFEFAHNAEYYSLVLGQTVGRNTPVMPQFAQLFR